MPEIFEDIYGRRIQLTDEGWAHIIEGHDFMVHLRAEIEETLREPDEIRRSLTEPITGRLYYRWYNETVIGDKWVCVVVKVLPSEAFVKTAYATGRIQQGELLWPI